MTFLFWCLPVLARSMIALFFLIEAIDGFRDGKPQGQLYVQLIASILLFLGVWMNLALVILFYCNNRNAIETSDFMTKLNRLLLINGILIYLFNPQAINSLIIFIQRNYIYHN